MLTIEINKTFNSLEECEEWEDKNFPDRTYNGHTILCVNHESNACDNKVTITNIMCF